MWLGVLAVVTIGAGSLVPGTAAAAEAQASATASVVAVSTASTTVSTSTTSPTSPDCPPGVDCEVKLAAQVDNGYGCNWSNINRPVDIPIQGINIHTTEGSTESALAHAQDTNPSTGCVSWNYLVTPTGKLYVQVPTSGYAYDVANSWFNTHFVQIEIVGYAEDCSTITPAAFETLKKLNRFLIPRFGILPSAATINGHDTVPGRTTTQMRQRHWDPGTCFPWTKVLSDSYAPIVQTGLNGSSVITIRSDDTHQTVLDCPGLDASKNPLFTGCQPAPAGQKTNFLHVYTAPSTSSPLISDPYLHPDGSAGTIAEQDWGDKALTGHSYPVLARQDGWTKIQFGPRVGWIQANSTNTVPTLPLTITPKGTAPVAVYGVPIPEASAPGWAQIPYDFVPQTPLTQYTVQPGQRLPLAALPVRSDYPEGCNRTDCSGPGDRTVVIGSEQFYAIWYGHFIVFVKKADVSVRLLGLSMN